jgi:hypothetical protein
MAFHVNRHGEPIVGGGVLIDWESRPEQVAYHAPYICPSPPLFLSFLLTMMHVQTHSVPTSSRSEMPSPVD